MRCFKIFIKHAAFSRAGLFPMRHAAKHTRPHGRGWSCRSVRHGSVNANDQAINARVSLIRFYMRVLWRFVQRYQRLAVSF
jgi:hypothetical protein